MRPTSVTFFYDADCAICSALARWIAPHTQATLRSIQTNEVALVASGLTHDELFVSAHAISDGRLVSGVRAIAALLEVVTLPFARALGGILTLPIVEPVAAAAYRWVARNRKCRG